MRPLIVTLIALLSVGCADPGGVAITLAPASRAETARLGWTSEGLASAAAFADSIGTSALLVLTNGKAVVAQGDLTHKYRTHSIRKSLLSALIGIAIEADKVDSAASLADLAIDDLRGLTPDERRATVFQLLQSRSGVYHPAASETVDMRAGRPERGSHGPGTFWYYNNWDFNALGTIFSAGTHQMIGEAFYQQIALPTGMEDFGLEDVEYHHEPSRSAHPSYRFRMSARDLARFGTLFLNGGAWGSVRVVPESWVASSTTRHSFTDQTGTKGGYGLMWWVTTRDDFELPLGSFTASGSGGQRLTVLPEIKTVVVHMMDTDVRGGPRIGTRTYNRLLSRLLAARSP